MKESNIQKVIMMAVAPFCRVFRNNVGTGWIGKVSATKDGGKYIENPRPLHAGLCTGSSDLIGWTERTITPDMVGKKIAIFTAIEVKKTNRSVISKHQLNFIDQVRKSGGIAGIATSGDQAINLVKNM